MDAPSGKMWIDGATHSLVFEWRKGVPSEHSGREESIRDVLSRMDDGLVDCPEDCECRD